MRLPARSPNLNAYAEHFVGSIRRECLDRVIPFGEQHLRRIVAQYVRHYNTERNHQGIRALADPPRSLAGEITRSLAGEITRSLAGESARRIPAFLHRRQQGCVSAWIEFW